MFRLSSHYNIPRILISEITESDPYFHGLISDDEHPGPLIALLTTTHFDKLVVIADEDETDRVSLVEKEIGAKFPSLAVQIERLKLSDDVSSERMDESLKLVVEKIQTSHEGCHISVALNGRNMETFVAWLKQTSRFDRIALLLVRQNMHAASTPPDIEVIEESRLRHVHAETLREPEEPTVEELAKELDLVGNHPSFRQLLSHAWAMAKYDVPVLITGEKGSGKTSLANFVWRASLRSQHQMQTASAVDLPDPLTSMLLFGGNASPDDAPLAPSGKIAASANSTLLIENVEKLSPRIQDSIAEYLATKKFRPVGAAEHVVSNARLIFTSDDDSADGPAKMTTSLRTLLMNAVLRIPPLRERRDDIPLIALHYLRHINLSLKSSRSMSREMLRNIQSFHWTGNVRELRLAVEKAALLSSGRDIVIDAGIPGERGDIDSFRVSDVKLPEIDENFSMEAYLGEVRRKLILRALNISKGNQSEAARLLKITPQAVHQFLKIHNKIKQGKK